MGIVCVSECKSKKGVICVTELELEQFMCLSENGSNVSV